MASTELNCIYALIVCFSYLFYPPLQSDIVHQSVFELIHSEDREDFKTQLAWNSTLPADRRDLTLAQILASQEHRHFLERSFTVRFRCLLDNTSGFVVSWVRLVGRLVSWMKSRFASWLLGWLVLWLVDWLVGRLPIIGWIDDSFIS